MTNEEVMIKLKKIRDVWVTNSKKIELLQKKDTKIREEHSKIQSLLNKDECEAFDFCKKPVKYIFKCKTTGLWWYCEEHYSQRQQEFYGETKLYREVKENEKEQNN